MAFPPPADELALHERILVHDAVAPVDLYQSMMPPLAAALRHDLSCSEEEAHDSAIDAILAYLEAPGKFDRRKGRLSTFLSAIAKRKAIDRLRARTAAERRDDAYSGGVELGSRNPKDIMESEVEAERLWPKVEKELPNERDRQAMKLILAGESSPKVLAEALGLHTVSEAEQRKKVKQHRDRLMKVLERLGARLKP